MIHSRAVVVAALCAAVWVPTGASAQGEIGELVTDRPDFTESSQVVGPGIVQVEMGSALEFDGGGDDRNRTFTTPMALVRVGVSRTMELRFSGAGNIVNTLGRGSSRVSTSGGSDFEVGMKWAFLDNTDAGFQMGVIPFVSFPVGSSTMTSGTYDTTVKLTWAKSLPRGFDLSGNANVSHVSDEDGRFAEQSHSVSVAHGLGGAWGGYFEAYGFVPNGRRTGQAWTLNGGVTRGVGNNLQFDIEGGRGITAAAPDWFVSFGMAVRTAALRRSQK